MLTLQNIPIEVYWRALDLYGVERETDASAAREALASAEARKDIKPDFPGVTPFAQAVAEYLSLSGPFAENGGEFAGCHGYATE